MGNFGKTYLQLLILILGSKRLRPVECKVKMASPVINLTDFTGRRLVVIEKLANSLVKCLAKNRRLVIVEGTGQVIERSGNC